MRKYSLLLAAVAAIVLAGCTPISVDSRHAASAGPTPSATALVGQGTVPAVRIPIDCSSILTSSKITPLVGETVTLVNNGSRSPANIDDVADRQYGTLSCEWGGKTMDNGDNENGVTVDVAPDSKEGFRTTLQAEMNDFEYNRYDVPADAGAWECDVYKSPPAQRFGCGSTILVGNSWAEVSMAGQGSRALTDAKVLSGFRSVLASAVHALRTTNASASFVPPTRTRAPEFCADPRAASRMATAWRTADLRATRDDEFQNYNAGNILESTAAYAACTFKRDDTSAPGAYKPASVEVKVLDGGGWALANMMVHPPHPYYAGLFRPVSIPGTDNALLACANEGCTAMMQVGDTFEQIAFGKIPRASAVRDLAATAKAISAG